MMLQPRSIYNNPQQLLQNVAAPQGLAPPSKPTVGGADNAGVVGNQLLSHTIRQVNTARVNGLGGKVDLLG